MEKKKPLKPSNFNGFRLAGAKGLEPLTRGFGDHGKTLEFQRF